MCMSVCLNVCLCTLLSFWWRPEESDRYRWLSHRVGVGSWIWAISPGLKIMFLKKMIMWEHAHNATSNKNADYKSGILNWARWHMPVNPVHRAWGRGFPMWGQPDMRPCLTERAGGLAQWLRVLAALAEEHPHGDSTICNLSLRGTWHLLPTLQVPGTHMIHRYTCRQIHTH